MPLYKTIVKKVSIPQDKKVKQKNYEEVGQLAVVDQGKDIIGGYSNDFDKRIECDLPVVIFGDHTCTVKYINFPFAAGADGIKILESKDNVVPKYLYYGTKYLTLRFPEKGYARHYQHIEKMDLFLPTVSEQRRIVSRIEELFSKLDKGVETLQTIKQQLAVYRQAVLTEAFEGIENTVELGSIASIVDPHPSHRTPVEVIGGVPYIGVGDIDYVHHVIDFSSARKVSNDILQDHLSRYTLHDGDFIMGKIGTIGKPFIIALPQNYTLSANVILIQPNKKVVIPKYLFWQVSSSQITKQLLEGSTSTTQPAFGIKKARLLSIKICSLEEQNRIVQKIESHLSLCDDIGQSVTAALSQAEAMRQSILKQAFEGKL